MDKLYGYKKNVTNFYVQINFQIFKLNSILKTKKIALYAHKKMISFFITVEYTTANNDKICILCLLSWKNLLMKLWDLWLLYEKSNSLSGT